MDILQLLQQGHDANTKAAVRDRHRVGSTGIVVGRDVIGVCHRVALARYLGIDKPATLDTKIMWEAGYRNEDTWTKILTLAGVKIVLPEYDDGRVMGHPDMVIHHNGEVLGLELKGIFGHTTAASVLEGAPKTENLIQTAVYSMLLKIPFDLCYTSSSHVRVNNQSVKPFYRIFHTRWHDGAFDYQLHGTREWTRTVITEQSIRDYWDLVDEMRTRKNISLRPSGKTVLNTMSKYGPCALCDFRSACDQADTDPSYDRWIDMIKTIAGGVA